MNIKELNKLNEDVINEIKELVTQCNKHDDPKGMIALDTSYNFNQDMNTIFLLYDEDELVSAMTLFIPGCEEAEVSAMTLPEYRKKGCFSELVKRAELELKKYGVPEILFVCEGRSDSGKAAVAKQNAQYEFTEYLLKYNNSLDEKIYQYKYRIKLYRAGLDNVEDLIKISMSAFEESYENAKSLAIGALNAENRQVFLGEIAGEYVAMGVTAVGDGSTSIHGLGVMSEHQGKGYGKEMLYSIMKSLKAAEVESISIEVDSENTNAFELYKGSGFEVESSWEYYRRAIV